MAFSMIPGMTEVLEDNYYGRADIKETSGKVGHTETTNIAGVPEGKTINPLSYAALINDFNRFRAVARSKSDEYDMPGHVYFRVIFHFANGSDAQEAVPAADGETVTSGKENSWTGLIAPSWLDFGADFSGSGKGSNVEDLEKLWRSSTAFNYFVINGDEIRARQTKEFIELLSNISSECPWYFQSIKGLDTAIERAITVSGADFALKEERDKITIECLDDSYDQRIGTLLDLYRAIVWSWETKRVMLPVNLRKFDMTIIAFQMPLRGRHISRNTLTLDNKVSSDLISETSGTQIANVVRTDDGLISVYTNDSSFPVASFKAWEFHGCEIDYNSTKSGWTELDNANGSAQKYSIDIYYDDMFESRFNEFLGDVVTDVVGDDISYPYDNWLQPTATQQRELHIPATANYKKPGDYPHKKGPQSVGSNMFGNTPRGRSGIVDQLVGAGKEWAMTKLKKIYLGNMNGLSIKRIGSQISQALDGDLWGTVGNVTKYARGDWKGGKAQLGENLFPKPETRSTDRIIALGNIFRANTAINT